ncbi:TonB-dependent receptor [Geofilum rubicundum JCM 15548]|uniref:TonB-dependent receptor n=1 Tax=Geofilum rubicundum JCM 15548 TaxID=1236989 RepID=A0A0E9M032_9BACT|nr:TonB-dependent receptor [Geofilum rubicundum JCM 15548]
MNASALAQTRVVEGFVTTLNDLTVSNLRVTAEKAGSAVMTDSLGRFTIVTNAKDVLRLTSRDNIFKDSKVRINRRTPDTLNIHLTFNNTPENQELVVGYGYVKRSELTQSVSQMENKRNDFCHYSNIFELIKGRLAGVQVVGGGREPEVIIRGISSINSSNAALYVVDGMVVNSISHISPCHVKSISVLKDSSASIYGSRGANGVVLIETKKGGQP